MSVIWELEYAAPQALDNPLPYLVACCNSNQAALGIAACQRLLLQPLIHAACATHEGSSVAIQASTAHATEAKDTTHAANADVVPSHASPDDPCSGQYPPGLYSSIGGNCGSEASANCGQTQLPGQRNPPAAPQSLNVPLQQYLDELARLLPDVTHPAEQLDASTVDLIASCGKPYRDVETERQPNHAVLQHMGGSGSSRMQEHHGLATALAATLCTPTAAPSLALSPSPASHCPSQAAFEVERQLLASALHAQPPHVNVAPLVGLITSPDATRVATADDPSSQPAADSQPTTTTWAAYSLPGATLAEALRFSPHVFASDDMRARLAILQIVQGLHFLHGMGLAHGALGAHALSLSPQGWVQLVGVQGHQVQQQQQPLVEGTSRAHVQTASSNQQEHDQQQQQQPLFRAPPLPGLPGPGWHWPCGQLLEPELVGLPLQQLTQLWQARKISNMSYLMCLNHYAGRRVGDRTFHPIMPWCMDFTRHPHLLEPSLQQQQQQQQRWEHQQHSSLATSLHPPPPSSASGGWHDLTQSKHRQSKGDEQLDMTFATSGAYGGAAHHVSSEPLSELSYCIYMARVLPQQVLTAAVRSTFQPNEYPRSVAEMYASSPDECIPELYACPEVFASRHEGLSDLQVPGWASGPEDFVALHRQALESDHVSAHLHHWIDLMFGYQLSGEAAVAAKNVYHSAVCPGGDSSSGGSSSSGSSSSCCVARRGMCQLFTRPHPQRLPAAPAVAGATTAFALEHLAGFEALAAVSSEHGGLIPASTVAVAPGPVPAAPLRLQQPAGPVPAAAELSAFQSDVQALGQLVVQVYLGRSCLGPVQDMEYWRGMCRSLPAPARRFAHLCLFGSASCRDDTALGSGYGSGYLNRRQLPSTDDLLLDSFFTPGVRAAQRLLQAVLSPHVSGRCNSQPETPFAGDTQQGVPIAGTPIGTGASASTSSAGGGIMELLRSDTPAVQLLALADAARAGALAALTQHPCALELCMPHILAVLSPAKHTGSAAQPLLTVSLPCRLAPAVSAAGTKSALVLAGAVADTVAALCSCCSGSAAAAQLAPLVRELLLAPGHLPDDCQPAQRASTAAAPAAAEAHKVQEQVQRQGDRTVQAAASAAAAAIAHALLHPELQLMLLRAAGLAAYTEEVLPALLSCLLVHTRVPHGSSAAGHKPGQLDKPYSSISRALASSEVWHGALAALPVVAAKLPMPILLDCVVTPLLQVFGSSPAAAQALVAVCRLMGGASTACHVMWVVLRAAIIPAGSTAVGSAGGTAAANDGRACLGAGHTSGGHSTLSTAAGQQLAKQVNAALGVMESLVDVLPKEYIPRLFLHGASSMKAPASASASASAASQGAAGSSAAADRTAGPAAADRGASGAAGTTAGAGATASPVINLMSVLMRPQRYVVVPHMLTRLALLVLRAFERLTRSDNLAVMLLPHFKPLLQCPPNRRAAYADNAPEPRHGSVSSGAGAHPAAAGGASGSGSGALAGGSSSAAEPAPPASADSEAKSEAGYYHLVHAIYRDLASASGLLTVRSLMPGTWGPLETALSQHCGWAGPERPASTAVAAAGGSEGAATAGSGVFLGSGDSAAARVVRASSSGGGSAGAWPMSPGIMERHLAAVRQELASKQQQIMALQSTNMFLKGIGWSEPSPAAPTRASPRQSTSQQLGASASSAGGLSEAAGWDVGSSRRGPSGSGASVKGLGLVKGQSQSSVKDGLEVVGVDSPLLTIGSPTVAEGLGSALAKHLPRQSSRDAPQPGFSQRHGLPELTIALPGSSSSPAFPLSPDTAQSPATPFMVQTGSGAKPPLHAAGTAATATAAAVAPFGACPSLHAQGHYSSPAALPPSPAAKPAAEGAGSWSISPLTSPTAPPAPSSSQQQQSARASGRYGSGGSIPASGIAGVSPFAHVSYGDSGTPGGYVSASARHTVDAASSYPSSSAVAYPAERGASQQKQQQQQQQQQQWAWVPTLDPAPVLPCLLQAPPPAAACTEPVGAAATRSSALAAALLFRMSNSRRSPQLDGAPRPCACACS